jgi:hypothetical protein
MLQNGIGASGSTPDLYGPEINMKWQVGSLHEGHNGCELELWKNHPSEENICVR